ncbi:uncharacterized protein LOC129748590 [Uranotaenia lowii]|uniref:uncharacterized protein LOC129748590 n=1 Tax=Uranotaenia lowii TaxID=190385 RepID=UPI00247918EA|nr:uncharacterized protein LOC129748590 [Uranotaenia lowii]
MKLTAMFVFVTCIVAVTNGQVTFATIINDNIKAITAFVNTIKTNSVAIQQMLGLQVLISLQNFQRELGTFSSLLSNNSAELQKALQTSATQNQARSLLIRLSDIVEEFNQGITAAIKMKSIPLLKATVNAFVVQVSPVITAIMNWLKTINGTASFNIYRSLLDLLVDFNALKKIVTG